MKVFDHSRLAAAGALGNARGAMEEAGNTRRREDFRKAYLRTPINFLHARRYGNKNRGCQTTSLQCCLCDR